MSEYRWSAPASIQNALTTTLNSLADDDNDLMASAIDNTSNRKTFIDLEVSLASVDLSSQDNPAIYIWFITSIDGGSTYEDGDGTPITPARQPDIIIPLREVSAAQVVIQRNIIFPPFNVKLMWGNRTGTAHASSGNTLKYRLHSMEDN